MNFDKDLVAGKLRRWDRYLNRYHLPAWEEIPDIGLYMEQVVTLLRGYLDYLPPELKEEEAVTAAAINNYVRTRAMPGPVKKRYYRLHLAYLIMICTLKQGLGISLVQRLIPSELTEEELRPIYTEYIGRHSLPAVYFTRECAPPALPFSSMRTRSRPCWILIGWRTSSPRLRSLVVSPACWRRSSCCWKATP